jgi:hypothetical protein
MPSHPPTLLLSLRRLPVRYQLCVPLHWARGVLCTIFLPVPMPPEPRILYRLLQVVNDVVWSQSWIEHKLLRQIMVDVVQANGRMLVEVHDAEVQDPSSNVSNGSVEYKLQSRNFPFGVRWNLSLRLLPGLLAVHVICQVLPLERFPCRTNSSGEESAALLQSTLWVLSSRTPVVLELLRAPARLSCSPRVPLCAFTACGVPDRSPRSDIGALRWGRSPVLINDAHGSCVVSALLCVGGRTSPSFLLLLSREAL